MKRSLSAALAFLCVAAASAGPASAQGDSIPRIIARIKNLDQWGERSDLKKRLRAIKGIKTAEVLLRSRTMDISMAESRTLKLTEITSAIREAEESANGRSNPKAMSLEMDSIVLVGKVRLATIFAEESDKALRNLSALSGVARVKAVRAGQFELTAKAPRGVNLGAIEESLKRLAAKTIKGGVSKEEIVAVTDVIWTSGKAKKAKPRAPA